MSRKDIPQDGGDEPKGKGAMGDPSFELGFLRIGLVEMDRIKVSNGLSKEVNFIFCNGLGNLGRISNFEFIDGFPFDHKN